MLDPKENTWHGLSLFGVVSVYDEQCIYLYISPRIVFHVISLYIIGLPKHAIFTSLSFGGVTSNAPPGII